MRPLMLGYLSVPEKSGESTARRWMHVLETMAQLEGYTLCNVFRDPRGESFAGFQALREAIRQGVARSVIVPSFDHLAHVPGLNVEDAALLSRSLCARLVVADARSERV